MPFPCVTNDCRLTLIFPVQCVIEFVFVLVIVAYKIFVASVLCRGRLTAALKDPVKRMEWK